MSDNLFINVDGKVFDLDRIPHDSLVDLQNKCLRELDKSHPCKIKEWQNRIDQIQSQFHKRAEASESDDPLVNGEYERSIEGRSLNSLRFARHNLVRARFSVQREKEIQIVQNRINFLSQDLLAEV